MEKELITFEVAKLAKEKGFNDWTMKAFESNGEIAVGGIGGAKLWNNLADCIARPSQALLQRWLREEKKLAVQSNFFMNDLYFFEIISISTSESLVFDGDSYPSYEEALEAGLQAALRLI